MGAARNGRKKEKGRRTKIALERRKGRGSDVVDMERGGGEYKERG